MTSQTYIDADAVAGASNMLNLFLDVNSRATSTTENYASFKSFGGGKIQPRNNYDFLKQVNTNKKRGQYFVDVKGTNTRYCTFCGFNDQHADGGCVHLGRQTGECQTQWIPKA